MRLTSALAHYDITRRRIDLVANGAKRTVSRVMSTRPSLARTAQTQHPPLLVRKRWCEIHQSSVANGTNLLRSPAAGRGSSAGKSDPLRYFLADNFRKELMKTYFVTLAAVIVVGAATAANAAEIVTMNTIDANGLGWHSAIRQRRRLTNFAATCRAITG